MKVSEVIEKDFIKLNINADLVDVAKMFIEKGEDYALVLNDSGELEGIVTETDLIFQEKNLHIPTFFTLFDSMIFLGDTTKFNDEMKKIAAIKVEEIMTKDILTVTQDTSVNEAATTMLEKDIHHLPVLEGKKPIGVVTKEGLLKAFIKERTAK